MKIVGYEKGKYDDEEVLVTEVSVTYEQKEDCAAEDQDGVQSITLSTANNGIARFIRIKTDNWAISDEGEIVELINDFKKRAEILG